MDLATNSDTDSTEDKTIVLVDCTVFGLSLKIQFGLSLKIGLSVKIQSKNKCSLQSSGWPRRWCYSKKSSKQQEGETEKD